LATSLFLKMEGGVVTIKLIGGVFLGLFLISPTAYGQSDPYKSKRGFYGELYDVKVYNPETKSYFEMKQGKIVSAYQIAHNFAKSQFYKGARGRLAIIKSKRTQEFINRILRPPRKSWGETWIGLRMTCRPRKLVWNTGEVLDREKDYSNWGKQWHYPDKFLPCTPPNRGYTGNNRYNAIYAGIALRTYKGILRWWAIAPAHFVSRALIEYPTGKP
jgi:Lectin C-type domain